MPVALTIGDFSRMTHLSVKTLRYYHQVGLLDPVEVDPATGYRYYATDQVAMAQAIRRFRDLQMPVEEVRGVLSAPDLASRNALILAHLDRMEGQLAETQSAVASLRELLERPGPPISIEHRALPAAAVLAIAESVDLADLATWWSEAFDELHEAIGVLGIDRTGPDGALFDNALFEEERGDVVAFVPVGERAIGSDRTDRSASGGRVARRWVPAVDLVVAVHEGSHDNVDRTYGALGTYVAERSIGASGPVREHYTVSRHDTSEISRWRTEIGWPVIRPEH